MIRHTLASIRRAKPTNLLYLFGHVVADETCYYCMNRALRGYVGVCYRCSDVGCVECSDYLVFCDRCNDLGWWLSVLTDVQTDMRW